MRFAKISFLSLVLMAIGFVGNAEAQLASPATADMTPDYSSSPPAAI
jgi:hypothetical protein